MGQLFQKGGLTNEALIDPDTGQAQWFNPDQQRRGEALQAQSKALVGRIQPSSAVIPDQLTAPGETPATAGPTQYTNPQANLPWLKKPTFQQAAQIGAPAPGMTNALSPGLSKGGKLASFLMSGLQGALAGRASQEETIAATGGRRAGGVGQAFQAAQYLPWLRASQQQGVQRGAIENQMLQAGTQPVQTPAGPLPFFLAKQYGQTAKDFAEANKATTEAGAIPTKQALEQAQTEAANYKEDPNLGLIDIRTGKPVAGNAGMAPLSADEAAILGKQPGDNVPLKLKNTANEMVNRGIRSVSAGGRQLLVDGKGNTIKDLGQATPLTVVNANMGAFGDVNSPQMQSLVDQVGTGKVDLPTALSSMRRNPAAAANFMGALFTKYPDYSQAQYGVSKKTMEYFTTGAGGNELNAFRTAIAHADLLKQAAAELNNPNSRTLAGIRNRLKTEFGDPDLTDLKAIAGAYTREVQKALSSGHITQGDVSEVGATMPANANLETINKVASSYQALMSSKAQQRMIQYEQGLKAQPAFPPGMTPGATGNAAGNRPPLASFEH